jgi:hypothetical protein
MPPSICPGWRNCIQTLLWWGILCRASPWVELKISSSEWICEVIRDHLDMSLIVHLCADIVRLVMVLKVGYISSRILKSSALEYRGLLQLWKDRNRWDPFLESRRISFSGAGWWLFRYPELGGVVREQFRLSFPYFRDFDQILNNGINVSLSMSPRCHRKFIYLRFISLTKHWRWSISSNEKVIWNFRKSVNFYRQFVGPNLVRWDHPHTVFGMKVHCLTIMSWIDPQAVVDSDCENAIISVWLFLSVSPWKQTRLCYNWTDVIRRIGSRWHNEENDNVEENSLECSWWGRLFLVK